MEQDGTEIHCFSSAEAKSLVHRFVAYTAKAYLGGVCRYVKAETSIQIRSCSAQGLPLTGRNRNAHNGLIAFGIQHGSG